MRLIALLSLCATVFHTTPTEAWSQPGCVVERNVDYMGNDLHMLEDVATIEECMWLCNYSDFFWDEGECAFWSFSPDQGRCWLKSSDAGRMENYSRISGTKECGKDLTPVPLPTPKPTVPVAEDDDPRCYARGCMPRGDLVDCDTFQPGVTRCGSCVGVAGACNGFSFDVCPTGDGALWCGNPDGTPKSSAATSDVPPVPLPTLKPTISEAAPVADDRYRTFGGLQHYGGLRAPSRKPTEEPVTTEGRVNCASQTKRTKCRKTDGCVWSRLTAACEAEAEAVADAGEVCGTDADVRLRKKTKSLWTGDVEDSCECKTICSEQRKAVGWIFWAEKNGCTCYAKNPVRRTTQKNNGRLIIDSAMLL